MTSVVRPRLQAVMIAIAVAFMATEFDSVFTSLVAETVRRFDGSGPLGPGSYFPGRTLRDTAFLIFGVLLVASHPKRSGLTLGSRENVSKSLAVCAVIIGGTLAYRFAIEGTAFADWTGGWSIWAISPIAQELVFSGFILGLLHEHFPRWWHRSLPITTGVVVTTLLFGFWHFIPDFVYLQEDVGYVAFRLAYTMGPWLLYAMTRIWTGSIIYAIAMHIAVNFITLGL